MSSASSGPVASTVSDGVLELVLDQPERRNPIDYATLDALLAALRGADGDAEVRAVLIRGEGKGFCSGGDLAEFRSEVESSSFDLYESGAALADLMTLLPRLRIPVVVAAHGFAMAGGLGLLASADVALAAEDTKMGTSEIKIGLFPLMILPALNAAVGPRRARELALTGRVVLADEALTLGLVHRVLPAEGFAEAARAIALELAALGSDTMRLGKAHLRDTQGLSLEAGVELGRAKRGAFMTSPDFAEGVNAFLEKRPPRFR
jgi:enoyl-CoA hydratase/carnithine racemase